MFSVVNNTTIHAIITHTDRHTIHTVTSSLRRVPIAQSLISSSPLSNGSPAPVGCVNALRLDAMCATERASNVLRKIRHCHPVFVLFAFCVNALQARTHVGFERVFGSAFGVRWPCSARIHNDTLHLHVIPTYTHTRAGQQIMLTFQMRTRAQVHVAPNRFVFARRAPAIGKGALALHGRAHDAGCYSGRPVTRALSAIIRFLNHCAIERSDRSEGWLCARNM